MARFNDVHFYPYSGWPDIPWGLPKPMKARPTATELDIDAAARSSRRVTEAISAELRHTRLNAASASLRIRLEAGTGPDMVARINKQRSYAHMAGLTVPDQFRLLPPSARSEALARAVEMQLLAVAEVWNWDPAQVGDALSRARDQRWEAAFVGPWKRTRDRRRRVRLVGRIHDDGYCRWRIGLAEPDSEQHIRESEEVRGWTWLENLRQAAASLRFIDNDRLQLSPGSRFIEGKYVVHLGSGAVERPEPEERVLSYPGDALRAPSRPKVSWAIN